MAAGRIDVGIQFQSGRPIINRRFKMSAAEIDNVIRDLEITKAYAVFKTLAGDLGSEYDDWVSNIEKSIEAARKK